MRAPVQGRWSVPGAAPHPLLAVRRPVHERRHARGGAAARAKKRGGDEDQDAGSKSDYLGRFKSGEFEVLVATDVAARGIDISGVSHVINYRVPENAEDYVHRIGRTGRAEAEGDAFTLLTADELEYAKSVEIFVDQKIPRRKLDNFPYIYTALLDDSPSKPIRKKPQGGKKKRR